MTVTAQSTDRGPLEGVRMILRYNWPLYAAGVVTAATGGTIARRASGSRRLRFVAATTGAVATWLSVASVVASWWVYDRSELYQWTWLPRMVPGDPARILVVHAGLDEASEPLARMWRGAAITSLDVHGGSGRTTASLRIARRHTASGTATGVAGSEGHDLVIAFLAAHELRSRVQRVELMRSVATQLATHGRLVVVEHVRDVLNALAFGPAVGHFYPVQEWRRAITLGGLRIIRVESITPFVRVIVAERVS